MSVFDLIVEIFNVPRIKWAVHTTFSTIYLLIFVAIGVQSFLAVGGYDESGCARAPAGGTPS